jgi:hypothetical protein
MGLLCLAVTQALAFPSLWPKGKDQAKDQDKDQDKDQGKDQDKGKGKDKGKDQGKDKNQAKDQDKNQAKDQGKENPKSSQGTQSKPTAASGSEAANSTFGSTTMGVPVEFVPSGSSTGTVNNIINNTINNASGTLNAKVDPMAIYRGSGVNPVEERKIRQLAQEFETMQRVRHKLLSNLLEEMRQFEFETDPNATAVLAKQEEINKLSALMANERIKLLLAIRDIMKYDEKQRLVDTLQRERR